MGVHSDRMATKPSPFLRQLTLVLLCFQFSAFVLVCPLQHVPHHRN